MTKAQLLFSVLNAINADNLPTPQELQEAKIPDEKTEEYVKLLLFNSVLYNDLEQMIKKPKRKLNEIKLEKVENAENN